MKVKRKNENEIKNESENSKKRVFHSYLSATKTPPTLQINKIYINRVTSIQRDELNQRWRDKNKKTINCKHYGVE